MKLDGTATVRSRGFEDNLGAICVWCPECGVCTGTGFSTNVVFSFGLRGRSENNGLNADGLFASSEPDEVGLGMVWFGD